MMWTKKARYFARKCYIRAQTRAISSSHILYQDSSLMIVNKPAGMLSHGNGQMKTKNSMSKELDAVSCFISYLRKEDKDITKVFLAPVNRIDKLVSGILVLCKKKKIVNRLQSQFKERDVYKEYLAIVEGEVGMDGIVPRGSSYESYWRRKRYSSQKNLDRSIKAKISRSSEKFDGNLQYSVVQHILKANHGHGNLKMQTVLKVQCDTGRKHQIRRQLAEIGHPVVGDILYGSKTKIWNKKGSSDSTRILLHANKLSFKNPLNPHQLLNIEAPLPTEFVTAMEP